MNDTSQEPEYLSPEQLMELTLKQIHRAIHNKAAMSGELPSIIDGLVDDE